MKIKFLLLCFVSVFFLSNDLISQTRGRTTRTPSSTSRRTPTKKTETVSLMDKMNFEIKVGNPGFANNSFSLTSKLNAGYKFASFASAGLGLRWGLLYQNFPAGLPDKTYLDYGSYVYGRGRLTNSIYLQAEYGYQNIATGSNRVKFWAPLVGGGYMQGTGKWSYGIELMFNLNGQAQDLNGPLEYWLNFSYKF